MAARAELGAFEPLAGLPGIHSVNKNNLRCTAVTLTDDSICLFSPVPGLGGAALASLEKPGPVSFLLAPNNNHIPGLKGYVTGFPRASLCCPPASMEKLGAKTR